MTKKNWIGKFAYSFEEGDDEFFAFEIVANYENGSFEGTVYDEVFSGMTGDLAKVKGFIEHDLISFVKIYPYYYVKDLQGKTIIDKNQKGHQVVYQGYFNDETGEWEGEWEIQIYEERDKRVKGGYLTKSLIGPWNMKLNDSLL